MHLSLRTFHAQEHTGCLNKSQAKHLLRCCELSCWALGPTLMDVGALALSIAARLCHAYWKGIIVALTAH